MYNYDEGIKNSAKLRSDFTKLKEDYEEEKVMLMNEHKSSIELLKKELSKYEAGSNAKLSDVIRERDQLAEELEYKNF